MADIERQIEELTRQLAELRSRQLQMNSDMILMEKRLESLNPPVIANAEQETLFENFPYATTGAAKTEIPSVHKVQQSIQKKAAQPSKRSFHLNGEMEDFIGTNVISKIGILVTIIGVFIGAKYAIDNELISPFLRIMTGYCVAAVLVSVAFKLKKKYQYFSSVLMGGGLAVIYFITYIAFSFYALLPMWLAFVVMIITTGATVGIALWYDQKVIALIGQIGAYAIPFLLGNKSGNVFGLFAYISFINIGLLALSFKKDWKVLYHIAFFLTWLIYLFWLVSGTQVTKNFSAGLLFLTINFFTFYVTFLSYKIFKKEQYRLGEISVLLWNALIYFFLGIYLIKESFQNIHFLTWFTISNAFIHFAAGYFIYRLQLADRTVFQFVSGLGLLFVTVAIPIELDGSWVTLLWSVEATSLFYIASANRRILYLDIALPLVIIAVLSLFHDWSYSYPYLAGSNTINGYRAKPFANVNFVLSMFVCTCLGYISYTVVNKPFSNLNRTAAGFFNKIIPVIFLFILYLALYNEIHLAWDKIIYLNQGKDPIALNKHLPIFQSLTLIMFSCIYLALWLINTKWIKKEKFLHLLLLFAAIVDVVFLTRGLYLSGELREDYLSGPSSIAFGSLLAVRYLSFAALAILWLSARKSIKTLKPVYSFQVAFSSLFNMTLLTIICNEFIHWMDMSGYQNQYKLGLSLIWGGYALALIFAGIIQKKKYLRISAMVLFGVTLLKLFFYDLASLSTISKTIVLVLLGILLLFASFLYNKYKDLLSGKEGS